MGYLPASGLSTVHSGVHGPALTYPRFSKQKVMPPSPTIISPAFNRSRMVPFYERSKEITPNWIILPIRRTDEKGDSERSDEKRNAFFILFYFFSRYTSSACSTLRARLALASTRVKNANKKKKGYPISPSHITSLMVHLYADILTPFEGK